MPRKWEPPAVEPSTYYPDWLVCQRCGYAEDPAGKDAEHWLVSPLRSTANVYVILCPRHITTYALRMTNAGMTRVELEKIRYGREVWAKQVHPHPLGTPLPESYTGADGREQ
jgi:hypothetical protein